MARKFTGHQAFKGRGALSNPSGRFEKAAREAVDDGWYRQAAAESIAQTIEPDRARSVITTNDSPDVGFDNSINPYRGCEHGCVYCADGDTRILMANGQAKALGDLQVGDEIFGTQQGERRRYYFKTQVLAHWQTRKTSYRITLGDGTSLVASADHRFLTEQGWKFVAGTDAGRHHRRRLAPGNHLLGFGRLSPATPASETGEYRRGYLCGVIRAQGDLGGCRDQRAGRAHGDVDRFRLAMIDTEALARTAEYLNDFGIGTDRLLCAPQTSNRQPCEAIRSSARASLEAITRLIEWPQCYFGSWAQGFIAGIFDAAGSISNGTVRIANSSSRLMGVARSSLQELAFATVMETTPLNRPRPMHALRVPGGVREQLRFFTACNPSITHKRSIAGQAVQSSANLAIVAIERLRGERELFDITTGSADFIANGVVSHNCFARPSHAYMGLSPGLDFETKLFYKADAAKILEAELAKPKYVCKPIALGINTDGYQPLEKRLEVTRSILTVLASCRHPVTIVTKSALVLRDVDLLADLARDRLASVMLSITSLSAEIKRTLEPRTASPQARLRVVQQLAQAGIPVGVLVAPVIPAITDHEMEQILEAAAEAGATRAGYVLLRLPYEVKDLFREWLAEHYPQRAKHVMSLINQARGGKDNDPNFGSRMRGSGPYAELLRMRYEVATRKLGLNCARARQELDTSLFRPPGPAASQLALGFD